MTIADDLLKMKKCPIIRTRFEDSEYFKTPDEEYEPLQQEKENKDSHTDNDSDEPINIQSLGDLLKERFRK